MAEQAQDYRWSSARQSPPAGRTRNMAWLFDGVVESLRVEPEDGSGAWSFRPEA